MLQTKTLYGQSPSLPYLLHPIKKNIYLSIYLLLGTHHISRFISDSSPCMAVIAHQYSEGGHPVTPGKRQRAEVIFPQLKLTANFVS